MAGREQGRRIILTGGGSGGHVTPLLGVADALREADPEVKLLYVGVRQGLEQRIVPRTGIPIRFATSQGMPMRPFSPRMAVFALRLGFGTLQAMGHLLRFRPHAIVASGGFASSPTVFAAATWRSLSFGLWSIPIYLHEQNAVPGRMNRVAGRFATRIGVSHPAATKGFSHSGIDVVGYPVRASLRQVDRAKARAELGLGSDELYLVVTGGSQGARTINRAIVDALPLLDSSLKLRILHASGTMESPAYHSRQDTEERLARLGERPVNYQRVDYIEDMPLHLAAADLAIIRAGAGSLVEVGSSGLPAIVIPKANLPGDSQVANARELAARGAIDVLYEQPVLIKGELIEAVDGKVLAERIHSLLRSEDRRRQLGERARESADLRAARRIAGHVLALAGTDNVPDPDTAGQAPPPSTAKMTALPSSPVELRRHIEKLMRVRWEQAIVHGRILDEELSRLPDLAYLRYRGAALLVHPAWQMRNEGVKLVGLTRNEAARPIIHHMITGRRPAPLLHRLLGGDFHQVGFIRRNAINALALLGGPAEPVFETIGTALADPYYEVRSAALRLLRERVRDGVAADISLAASVASLARDRMLEVQWEAIHCFGLVGEPEEVLALCRRYELDGRTRIREAVLRAWHALLDRLIREDRRELIEQVEHDLDRFAITSAAFHPHFPLKERYAELRRRLRDEESR